ncbi:hypothetical protein [Psychrobacter sp. I-STPA10]|uniref:hypothetical protein n=1 Tax=Psychrobacter sp. I-STPA10 TaxID=2585769 RepID=UPI001E5057EB|nr:hypothetical protein [Psychrobacter sp. I-STPA10]
MVTMALAGVLAMTGCATSSLLEGDRVTYTPTTKTVKQVLIEDQLVAFGRPAQPLPNMPAHSVVIVGEKQSYVLSQGGVEMASLLTNLTPQNIQVENDMSFYSPKNDGYFQGTMQLSYAKLKDEFHRSDYQYFLQHGGKECTTDSDARINAQRFCFTIPIKGGVYPQVSNLSLIQSKYQPLTKPYAVTIYTQSTQEQMQQSRQYGGRSGVEKLVLLPFALAFDVVTFPLQLLAN